MGVDSETSQLDWPPPADHGPDNAYLDMTVDEHGRQLAGAAPPPALEETPYLPPTTGERRRIVSYALPAANAGWGLPAPATPQRRFRRSRRRRRGRLLSGRWRSTKRRSCWRQSRKRKNFLILILDLLLHATTPRRRRPS